MSRIHEIKIFIAFFVLLSVYLGFSTNAYAINDTKATSDNLTLNSTYYDAITPEDTVYERYYKIFLEEGEIYSFNVKNQNTSIKEWKYFNFYLCYSSNTNSEDNFGLLNATSETKVLFKPNYSGYYYIKSEHYGPEETVEYSIVVKKANLIGTVFTDDEGDTYTILDNDTIELKKPGSVKSKSYTVSYRSYFDTIEDYSTLKTLEFEVTSIGVGAFKGNKYLKEVYMPDGLQKIKASAFQNCKNLKYVKMYTYTECELNFVGVNAFKGTKKGIKFSFPDKVKKYKKLFKNCGAKKPKYY